MTFAGNKQPETDTLVGLITRRHKKARSAAGFDMLVAGQDLNLRPSGYEPASAATNLLKSITCGTPVAHYCTTMQDNAALIPS
jgi:hypothetical protein